ncbi:hypothetical protein HRbin36_00031 [bacterium HR36]|nr:hypothetical protein HRbin36_00031 [bacterium HR36]
MHIRRRQRVHIYRAVQLAPMCFGWQVAERADARLRCRAETRQLQHPEIAHLHLPAHQKQILRLDVAVVYAPAVQELDPLRRLFHVRHQFIQWQSALSAFSLLALLVLIPPQSVRQCASSSEFPDRNEMAQHNLPANQRQHVRMVPRLLQQLDGLEFTLHHRLGVAGTAGVAGHFFQRESADLDGPLDAIHNLAVNDPEPALADFVVEPPTVLPPEIVHDRRNSTTRLLVHADFAFLAAQLRDVASSELQSV